MRMPRIQTTANPNRAEIVNSRGINLSDNIRDGDLAVCRNLASTRWPYLTTRNARVKQTDYAGATAITTWDKLVVVQGTDLLFDGKVVGQVTSGEKQFAVVNTKLVIWPDKVYLDMTDHMLKPLGAQASLTQITFTKNTMTTTDTSVDFTTLFKVGDGITLSGLSTLSGNNKDMVIKAVEEKKITLTADTLTEGSETGTFTLERRIPDLDFICESGNRLWGVSNQDKTIFSSVLGDPCNFYVYEGLSTDGYAVAVGSEGDFTGCVKLSTSILFWKERTLHKMLGDYPAEYALYDYSMDGLRTGCHKSMQIINDVLFYVGLHGVYTYAGGTPTSISDNFGVHNFEQANGGSDGERYYLSVLDDGQKKLLVYDPKLSVWLQEDDIRVVQFARLGRGVYMVDDTGNVWLADGGERDKDVEWMAQFTPFWETIEGRKRYSKLVLRTELEKGAWIKAEIRCDGGRWTEVGKRIGSKQDAFPLRIVPNRCDRFEVRLSGKGPCTIMNIMREFSVGGDS